MTTLNSTPQRIHFASTDKKVLLRLTQFSAHAELAMLVPAPKLDRAQTQPKTLNRLISVELRQLSGLLVTFSLGPLVSQSGFLGVHIAPLSSDAPLELKLIYKDYTAQEFTIPVEWKHPDAFNPRPAASSGTTSQ